MKKIWLLLIFFLVGCSTDSIENKYDLDNMNIQELVHELNFNEELKSEVSASIDGTVLTIRGENEELFYDVGDEFYLAVAPYINYTHT